MSELRSPSPFTPGGLQFAWDSTSLGQLKTCPRKYQLSILEGWRARREALPLAFGIAVHECLEIFHKAIALGEAREDALRKAVRHALAFGAVRDTSGFRPWSPEGDTSRTRETLLRTLVWYEARFAADPARTIVLASGQPATELSFRYEIGENTPEGIPYLFCGHLDRLIQLGEDTYVEDYKTTKQSISPEYYRRYTPDNQMSMYSLAAKVIFPGPISGVLITVAQLGVNFTRFDRGFALRTPAQLSEWFEDALAWLRLAEHWHAEQHWPMNDSVCGLWGGCPFRGVCDKDPSVREAFLQKSFEKRPWNPLSVR